MSANPRSPAESSSQAPDTDPAFPSRILEVTDALIVVLDRKGHIVLFNRACEEATGYTASEVAGKALEHLLEAEERDSARAVFARLLAGQHPIRHVNHWVGKDGQRRLIHWSNTVLRTPAGEVAWVIGTGVQASSVQGAGESLHEARQRAQAVLDTAVDGIVIIDEKGIIETFNAAAEHIFGYSAADVIGRNVGMLMPSPYREQHDAYLRHYMETGERRIIGIGREVSGLRRSGETFPMELAVGEVRLPGRRLFTGIVRDITQRKRIETEARRRLDELAHASRLAAMGEMASGVAHELNQPLTAIVSFAEACLRMERSGKHNPEVLHKTLQQIAEQGERAARIVRHLRQFVRKSELAYVELALNDVVRDVLRLLDYQIKHSDIQVRLELDDSLPPIRADRLQMEQVVLNLVHNAIDAAREAAGRQAELAIRTRRANDAVLFSVRDTGIGLPPEAQRRLFEPFYTTKPQGLGMGLSISRSIIEVHGGRLWAQNNADRGATFQFTLPIEQDSAR